MSIYIKKFLGWGDPKRNSEGGWGVFEPTLTGFEYLIASVFKASGVPFSNSLFDDRSPSKNPCILMHTLAYLCIVR